MTQNTAATLYTYIHIKEQLFRNMNTHTHTNKHPHPHTHKHSHTQRKRERERVVMNIKRTIRHTSHLMVDIFLVTKTALI